MIDACESAITKKWNIGVDIVDITRFRRLNYSCNKNFFDRVFTQREIKHCLSFENPAQHFAANFAAKEAVCKAMNVICDVKLKEIEILRDGSGVPYVNICARERSNHRELTKCQRSWLNPPPEVKVSISHSTSYVVAFAVVSHSEEL